MKLFSKAIALSATAGIALMGGAGVAAADGNGHGTKAVGGAVGSPGVFSGNLIQVPIDVPINVCGNTAQFIGALNPAFGNICINK
ncbi:chaplin [Streptomyces halobius]|uniref:Chaplin n=1 Tax=Streptomyces halobius TaxID=2879846 RepID=A0ABY4M8A8_9ACTN|nr:chaplin [Streptomyces halobius]UQA93972.1 chaplin [Streptomyces halobius]